MASVAGWEHRVHYSWEWTSKKRVHILVLSDTSITFKSQCTGHMLRLAILSFKAMPEGASPTEILQFKSRRREGSHATSVSLGAMKTTQTMAVLECTPITFAPEPCRHHSCIKGFQITKTCVLLLLRLLLVEVLCYSVLFAGGVWLKSWWCLSSQHGRPTAKSINFASHLRSLQPSRQCLCHFPTVIFRWFLKLTSITGNRWKTGERHRRKLVNVGGTHVCLF